jgi:hypothetical protein
MFNDSSFYLHDLDSLPFATNLYEGNHSNAYVVKDMKHITNTEEDDYTTSDEMITITSNSTPHAVIHFDGDGINKTRLPLLPTIGRNDDDRYLSIKDGRVPELSSWTHDIFSDDRGLLWNYYFNNIVDNFSHIKHPYFDISCSGKPVLNEAIDDFEKSNIWKIYAQTKNAIGV